MTLAEYKSIAKVGDRVCIDGFNQTVLALNTCSDDGPSWGIITDGSQWMEETFNGNPCGVWDFSEPYKITLLSDTPDWRTGLAPIPREELRVGMRIKDGLNGTPHTITKIFDGRAHNNEGFNAFFTDSSRATVDLFLVPSPDTEWHALTESNIAKYLAVGDKIEYQWKDPANNLEHTESRKISCINGEKIYTDVGGWWLNLKRCHHFRLIKKATPEVAREEERPIYFSERNGYKSSPITKPSGNKLIQVVTNLMKTVANSLLKDEDKAMRAKGYQDDKGEDTQMFIEEVQARRLKADCDEFRAAITADVVKVWKEEQEKK
jgi:hypothetical protein